VADSDGDGVPEESDVCPGTLREFPVDHRGCPRLTSRFSPQAVSFQPGAAKPDPSSRVAFDEIARLMKETPAALLEVRGHADELRSAAKNKALAKKRAMAVKAYLVKTGVSGKRLTVRVIGAAENKSGVDFGRID
jgi:OOP family OmpA-OmpF porin